MVRFGCLASINTCITVLTVSKVTNVRRAAVQYLQSLVEEYYECHTNDFFSKGRMDSAWTDREVHCLIDIWADAEIQTLLESAKQSKPIFEGIAKEMSKAGNNKTAEQCTEKIKAEDYKKIQEG